MTIDEATAPASLAATVREVAALQAELKAHEDEAAREAKRLRDAIKERQRVLSLEQNGVDREKVDLAETIVRVSDVRKGGRDWRSCVKDAVRQFALGEAEDHWKDLWRTRLSTKNYDRWVGQREDVGYGMGPRHGSIVFAVGLTEAARQRTQDSITPEEAEAAVYYLLNIERIQQATRETADHD